VDIRKTKRLLVYEPKITLKEGFRTLLKVIAKQVFN